MNIKKKIFGISGSTRHRSTNLHLIHAIADLTSDIFAVTIYDGLMNIPPFNPDNDNANAERPVAQFRNHLRSADGILICTPEYAMGVPGTLKNAIDWTVSSADFYNKPTALITASSVGEKGHASLIETLKVIDAKITEETQLLISNAKLKVSSDHKIIDSKTLTDVRTLIRAFNNLMRSDSNI